MEHLLEAYASSSSDDGGSEDKKATASGLGELPPELQNIFKDSVLVIRRCPIWCANVTEYDLATERLRAEERAGTNTPWVRRFPHERGNWPTHVFVPVPNSKPFRRMAEASVTHFRRRLATAWRERHGSGGRKRGKRRARDEQRFPNDARASSARRDGPPEVVMNSMEPSGQQHLSLSKTAVLRAHQIAPFVEGLKEAVKSSRSFLASVVSGYDVLVNEDKSRSFVCLRVRGGREMILKLIAKVDPLMRKFKQAEYYEDPVLHVSVASVLGDVSAYVGSSCGQEAGPLPPGFGGGSAGARTRDRGEMPRDTADSSDDTDDDEDEDVPSEICLSVGAVLCKAGTTYYEAPLLAVR
ncbi:unnamed protein product [Scytosiphon promiscuus]